MPKRLNSLLVFCHLISLTGLLSAAEVLVRLENAPATGTVVFQLYDSPNAFADLRDPVREEAFPLDGRKAYVIEGVGEGEYALLVYYDENSNQRIDQNFIGIPREPLGFSNAYQPKGPASFRRAAFTVVGGEAKEFEVELYRPLGERGRVGIGLGVIARSSPYRAYDGGVVQFIPAVTYTGERLRVYGPFIQYGLLGTGDLRLAATGQFRIGVYEEEDSDYLEGMGDRSNTFMGGLALQAELPAGFEISLGYQHDVLDEIGGGEARLQLEKSFQAGLLRLTPEVSVNWLSVDIALHDFGVREEQATGVRPEYEPGSTVTFELGVSGLLEINESWFFVSSLAVEFLGSDITDSPIVEEEAVIKGFGAVNYSF